MTNYENLINLPLNFNANNHAANNENNAKIAVAGDQLLNKMSQRDFSEVSPRGERKSNYCSIIAFWKLPHGSKGNRKKKKNMFAGHVFPVCSSNTMTIIYGLQIYKT